MHVLLVGLSTRAAAESAAVAGFDVTALDAYADLDQHPAVRALSLPRDFDLPFTARAAARVAAPIACDAVVYLSSFENHPRAVAALASGRVLWGNPPAVLRRVRDPRLLATTLHRHGLRAPAVYLGPPSPNGFGEAGDFLVKPLKSGGGLRIRPWRAGERVPRGCYLQRRLEGTPGSVLLIAARGRAVMLGVSRQLVGEPAFGAVGYRYCGNILVGPGARSHDQTRLVESADALAQFCAEHFDLVGANGIDFIAEPGGPCAIEVNPRWSASMELVERACGVSVFGMHAAACAGGTLPSFDAAGAWRRPGASGKAVVFAKRNIVVGDTRTWIGDPSVRDVPHPGDAVAVGRPICTVFAEGQDEASCFSALVDRAERVYAEVDRKH